MSVTSNIFSKILNKTNLILFIFFILLFFISFNYFLVFHTLVELFSVIIAAIIFVIATYSSSKTENHFLIILGIAYGFIGSFDLLHTLAYKGMGVFETGGSNLATQLWIIARYMESISIAIAFLFITTNKKYNFNKIIYSYITVTLLILLSLYLKVFPNCFIEEVGLTSFKIISEYIISGILIYGLFLLYKNKDYFKRYVYNLVFASIIFTIFSEIAFTFYVDVYGLSNITGHIFKLLSVVLIFKAIIETGFKHPYDLLFRELKIKKDQLEEEKKFIENIYNNINEGICVNELIYKDGNLVDYRIIDANSAYKQILEIPLNKAIGRLGSEIYDSEDVPFLDLYHKVAESDEAHTIEKYFESKDKYFRITVTSPIDGQFITLFHDITTMKEREERIRYLSFHDKLTGLYNRRYFENEMDKYNKSRLNPFSIIIIDLDKLKRINDNYGHNIGDEYLKKTAHILSEITRVEDIVARIGGDEFAIILPETDKKKANKIVRRIKSKFEEINKKEDLPMQLSISLGLATANDNKEDINEVYIRADKQMYQNKLTK